jgi:hypothetical protein
VLIVFDPDRQAPACAAAKRSVTKLTRSVPLGEGGWKLTATGYVASSKIVTINRELPTLIDWSLDTELRGFSGRAVYTTPFSVARTYAGSRLVLDLGMVKGTTAEESLLVGTSPSSMIAPGRLQTATARRSSFGLGAL